MTPIQSFFLSYLEKQAAPNFLSAMRAGQASRAVDAAARAPTALESTLLRSGKPLDRMKGSEALFRRRTQLNTSANIVPNPRMPGEVGAWGKHLVVDPETPLQRLLKRI